MTTARLEALQSDDSFSSLYDQLNSPWPSLIWKPYACQGNLDPRESVSTPTVIITSLLTLHLILRLCTLQL